MRCERHRSARAALRQQRRGLLVKDRYFAKFICAAAHHSLRMTAVRSHSDS
jgi:hypothetical protein